MGIRSSRQSHTIRRLVACALALWLAGVGCLAGCEMMVFAGPPGAAQPPATQLSEAAPSCHAPAGHDCCQATRDGGGDDEGANAPATGGPLTQGLPGISCCPLTNQPAAFARQPSHRHVLPALASAPLPPTPIAPARVELSSRPPKAPDRGGTYLRCCVFLI